MKLICKIDDIIEEKGFRPGFVAKKLGVTTDQLRNYRTGKSFPTVPKLFKLANILNVSVDALYEVADED